MNGLRDDSDSATTAAVALGRARGFGGGRELAAVSAAYLVLAIEVTIRLWADPASRMVAGNPGDADQVAWFTRYAAEAIAHLSLPAMTSTGLNAPHGISLMANPSSPFLGVLLTPVTLLAGPQASLTAALTLGFAGSALAMFAVLRRNGCTTVAAFLAGAVYGFSPALVHSAINHFDLQFAVFPPLIADAALRILTIRAPGGRGAQVRRGAWLGLLCAAQVLTDEEVLLGTALAVAIFAAVLAVSRPAMAIPQLRAATASLAAGLATVLVVTGYPLWTQLFGPLRARGSLFILNFYKNDLDDFVKPSSLELIHSASTAAFAASYQAGLPEYLGYLGWPMLVALLVAAVAFWQVLAVRMTAVGFVALEVFSLGGTLLLGGHDHPWLKLPWYWLQGLPLAGLVVSDRFSILADGAAAALLGFAVHTAIRLAAPTPRDVSPGRTPLAVPPAPGARPGASAIAIALCIAIVPLIPVALPAAPVPGVPSGWTAAYQALDLPADANVLTVPVPTNTFTEPMRWYADTGVPSAMVGGYIAGPAANGQTYMGGGAFGSEAQYLNQLWVESGGGTWAGPAGTSGIPLGGPVPSDRDAREQIDGWRLGAVMAVTSPGSPLAAYLTRLLGKPAVSAGAVLGWQLVPGSGQRVDNSKKL
ncbi:MAG TPA: hypothetical protein VN714_17615 [Trebonia sp.]|nr:hypothetical protein [Trebonia sp.]